MHMCEALIALFEATRERRYLDRATAIARKLTVELPASAGCAGRVCEHYSSEWQADPEKNRGIDPASEEYIFRSVASRLQHPPCAVAFAAPPLRFRGRMRWAACFG